MVACNMQHAPYKHGTCNIYTAQHATWTCFGLRCAASHHSARSAIRLPVEALHCARSRCAVQPRNDGLHAYVPSFHAFVLLVSMHCLSPAGRTSKQAVPKRWADVPPRVYDEKDDSPRSPRHAPPLPRCSPPRARPASEQAARPRTAAEVVAAVTADVGPRPGTTPAARPTICFAINGAADAGEDDRREAKVRALRGTSRYCGVLVGTAGY